MTMQGMVMLEDLTVMYRVLGSEHDVEGKPRVEYTATDGPTGTHETYEVDAEPFLEALACGLTFHGGESFGITPEHYAELEAVMPQNPLLRFIP